MGTFKATILLISINIGLYMLWQFTGYHKGALWVWGDRYSPLWSTITYGFQHNSLSHLAYNIMFLSFFLPIFEYKFGSIRTIYIYIMTTMISGFMFLFLRTGEHIITRGASGALYGIVSALIIGILSKEKVNIILLFTCMGFLLGGFYDTFTATNVNTIGHWGGALSGLILMTIMMSPQIKIKALKN